MTDDEPCFMMALYGAALTQGEIVPLVGEIAEFFGAAGHPLSHLEVDGRGFGTRPLQFKRAWKRLCKAAAEDIAGVDALALVEGGDSTLSDWAVTSAVDPERAYVHIGASQVVMPDAERQIVAFVRRVLGGIRPVYGIGFVRERARGPSLYGVGIGYGRKLVLSGPEREELSAISRWGHTGKRDRVYDQGIVRDIYPYNLLSACHLEREIDGRPLQAWIADDIERGRLEPWSHGCVLWTVDTEHIPTVRQALTGTGILYTDTA